MYLEGRRRLSAILLQIDDGDGATIVPACPEWAVRDGVAHLSGSCADVLAGRGGGATTAAWADAQVRQRQHRTVPEVLAEWSAVAPPLEATADHLPAPLPTIWILDMATHEHDVRGALR